MRKVLYFGNFDFVNGFAACNRAIGNAVCFSKLGYETYIFGTGFEGFSQTEFANLHHIHCIAKPFENKLKNYIQCDCYIECVKKINPTVVVFYNLPSIPFLKIMLYCRKHHIKIISDVTEWYSTKGVRLCLKPIKWLDTHLRMKYLNKKCDCLIVISTYLKNYYRDVKNKIMVYPVMDYVRWEAEKFGYYRTEEKRSDVSLIGKGVLAKDDTEFLKHLLLSLGKKRFNIIGINKESFEKKAKFKCPPNVFFYPKLNREGVLKIYSRTAWNYVVRKPNKSNMAGFPSKFAESMILGVPVIYNDFSDLAILKQKYLFGVDKNDDFDVDRLLPISDDVKEMFISDFYTKEFRKLLSEAALSFDE